MEYKGLEHRHLAPSLTCFSVVRCPLLWQVGSRRENEEGDGGGGVSGGGEKLDVHVSPGFFRQSYYQNANQLLPGQFAYSMLCSLKQMNMHEGLGGGLELPGPGLRWLIVL